jgi:hypothetical protein
LVDEISIVVEPTIHEYVRAISEYASHAPYLGRQQGGIARDALDNALGRAVAARVTAQLPGVVPYRDRIPVDGGLRTMEIDLVHTHPYDGVQLAIKTTAVNYSAGSEMGKRLSDTTQSALTLHTRFPFAVIGRIFSIPTWYVERKSEGGRIRPSRGLGKGLAALIPGADTVPYPRHAPEDRVLPDSTPGAGTRPPADPAIRRRSNEERLSRFIRQIDATRLRMTETDPAHLVEATAVLVYDPDTALIREDLPSRGLGLRLDEFIDALAAAYRLRFEAP